MHPNVHWVILCCQEITLLIEKYSLWIFLNTLLKGFCKLSYNKKLLNIETDQSYIKPINKIV